MILPNIITFKDKKVKIFFIVSAVIYIATLLFLQYYEIESSDITRKSINSFREESHEESKTTQKKIDQNYKNDMLKDAKERVAKEKRNPQKEALKIQ